jgi:hypothetical protein
VRLRYRILDSGPSVHALLTVSGRHGSVFAASTAPLDVVAGRAYTVPWRTPKRQRGLLSFCVRSVTAAGRQSAESCATVRLR